ncbi:MAG: hypothetical protein ACEPOV_10825 [Hyphomicrobiales bacterium]
MRRSITISLIAFMMIFVGSCKKNEEDPVNSLTINVECNNSQEQEIVVFTNPSTEVKTLKGSGSVTFSDVIAGEYEIYAIQKGFGGGSVVTSIGETRSIQRKVMIEEGKLLNEYLKIECPYFIEDKMYKEKQEFLFKVSQFNKAAKNVNVEVKSDFEGVIYKGKSDDKGIVRFATDDLSPNKHKISIIATDNEGYQSESTINLKSSMIEIRKIVFSGFANFCIRIEWEHYKGDNFKSIEVVGYTIDDENLKNPILISTITDKDINVNEHYVSTKGNNYTVRFKLRLNTLDGKVYESKVKDDYIREY